MKNIWNTNGNSQSPYTVQNVTSLGVDNDIVLFDGNSGKLIKDSTVPLYAHNDSFGIRTESQKLGTTNDGCISLGAFSMNDSQGTQNCISIGHYSSQLSIDPSNNIVIGYYGNNANLHGSWNTLISNYAEQSYSDSKSNNIILGNNYGTAGENGNIIIGDGNQTKMKVPNLMYLNRNSNNVAYGSDLSSADLSLTSITGLRAGALSNVTTGVKNTACGNISMQSTTSGENNCAYGFASLGNLIN
jgi:hypothetical protein